MAFYEVAVVNEDKRPIARVEVEAVSLTSWPTVTQVQETGRNGVATFSGLAGPHFFRPRVRRTSGEVGGRHYTGEVEVQVVKSGGESMNIDYVVDSNGMGTHLLLFGTTGALEAAIATGVSKAIWVCTSHVETVSATHNLTPLADNQRIVAMSIGRNTPVFTVGAGLGAAALITHSTGSSGPAGAGVSPLLRFQGLAFSRSGVTAGPFFRGSGGFFTPEVELIDVAFDGSAGQWTFLFDFNTAGSVNPRHILLERVRTYVGITALVNISSVMGTSSSNVFQVRGCIFAAMSAIENRTASTDVDIGRGGITVENNIFSSITSYGWRLTYTGTQGWMGFAFNDNIVINFTANTNFLELGTAGTTSPNDLTVDGNVIRCSNAGGVATAVRVFGGAGTARNISIVGNALRGPGNSVAIRFDIANADCAVLNSYRDWTTTVGGTVGPGSGTFTGDHGTLLGLADDDHTQYLLLAGRGAEQDIVDGLTVSTYFRVGSNATPANTTAGDLTCTRLNVGNIAFPAGIEAYISGDLQVTGQLELDGDLNHDGLNIGFFGVAPVARAAAYTPTNVTPDRSYDADTVVIAELADVVGTLIADLQAYGLLQ